MTNAELDALVWAGNVDVLEEALPCKCCCEEHTFTNCQARRWGGCRSGLAYGEADDEREAWQKHYAEHHGMTAEQFYGWRTW